MSPYLTSDMYQVILPYANSRENKTFALLELLSYGTIVDLIKSMDDYPYDWSQTILVDQYLAIVRIPGTQISFWNGPSNTMESDIEHTQCSLSKYSRALIMALVRAGLASVGLDIHSGKYCGRYNIIGTGSFLYNGDRMELRKVKGFQLYALSGNNMYFVNDIDTL